MIEVTRRPVKHLSVSKIEQMMKCPRAFMHRYVDKLPEMSVGVLLSGRVVHKVIERALLPLLKEKPLPSAKDMDDWFIPEWEAHVREEEEKHTFLGWEWGDEDSPELAQRECRALAMHVRKEFLPTVDPWLVEEGFRTQYNSGANGTFLVWGYIDLLERSGLLSDWKTTRKTPSDNQKKMGMQFPGYSPKVMELTGEASTKCRRIFLQRGPEPRIEVVHLTVEDRHRRWFRDVACEVWNACKADAFVPNTSTWVCKPGWCSFWGICQGELE